MGFVLKMPNKVLNDMSVESGIYICIEPENLDITGKEVQFLIEQVIKKVLDILDSKIDYEDILKIEEHFDLSL